MDQSDGRGAMSAAGVACGFVYLWIAVCCVRNVAVFQWRMFFINEPVYGPMLYKRLPGYYDMLFNLRHWNRWSQRAWLEYALRED
jgi:hypothetical protein